MPTSTTPCPATSAAAGPISAYARPSGRPRPADREAMMIIDRTASNASGRNEMTSENALSRRSLLQIGAAAGGGFMLSLGLPLAAVEAEAGTDQAFAPNAFVSIGRDGR